MKKFSIILSMLISVSALACASVGDTLHVRASDLNLKKIQTGDYRYVCFFQKTKESPATRIFLVNINVASELYHGKPAYVIKQHWDLDSLIHSAYSVFDAGTFATIKHDTYWKALGYTMFYDFEAKTVNFKIVDKKNSLTDSIKTKSTVDFNDSFKKYNLNWHEDLVIYSLLPYKLNRTFMINFYDPGFGKAEEVPYTVTGNELLTTSNGTKTDCWILYHPDGNSYEKFWISKKDNEVLKEEDFGTRGYRFKVKLNAN